MADRTPHAAPAKGLNQDPESVRWARETAGFTLTQLASSAGISLSLMSEIEGGTRNATAPNLRAIALALGCPIPLLKRKCCEQAA